LIDGDLITVADLEAVDSGVKRVAASEQISLEAKIGLAHQQLSDEVEQLLNPEYGPGLAASPRVEQVVVIPLLREAASYKTLELIYQDAFYSQANDRHGERMREFHRRYREAIARLKRSGIPMTAFPVRRPQPPQLTIVPGAIEAGAYFVRTSWTTSNGEESAGSGVATANADGAHRVEVRHATPPPEAAGWNVYAGNSPDNLRKQNQDGPLSLGLTWVTPDTGLVQGAAVPEGQRATFRVRPSNRLYRG